MAQAVDVWERGCYLSAVGAGFRLLCCGLYLDFWGGVDFKCLADLLGFGNSSIPV